MDFSTLLGNYSGIDGIVLLNVGIVVFFWSIGILWVTKDIHARTSSTISQLLSILLATVGGPIIGVPLYIALRPARYLESQSQHIHISVSAKKKKGTNPQYTFQVFSDDKVSISCDADGVAVDTSVDSSDKKEAISS